MWAKGSRGGRWRCSAAHCSPALGLVLLLLGLPGGAGASGGAAGASCPVYSSSFSSDAGASSLCTTITATTTTTTTTTTRPNTTTTLTSSPFPKECRTFCDGNGHQWFIKCVWPACAACMECNTLIIPEPPAPISGDPNDGSGSGTSAPTATPTPSPSGGGGPAPANPPTPLPTPLSGRRRIPAPTTTMVTRAPWCISSCRTASLPWSMICTWSTCMDCDECFPFTTTETQTRTTTTETATITTTTETGTTTTDTVTTTPTTTTRTTYPGETITWTSTTSTTSSTTTSTTTITRTLTTTTLTTTGMECSPPSPLLPTSDCQHNITAGGLCFASTFRTACVDQSPLVFMCSVNNTEHEEPHVVRGTYGVHCQICAMLTPSLIDTDPRPGVVSSVLRFGPNAMDGVVNETEILGYAVFVVDECGRTVGDLVAYAERRPSSGELCCQHDAYTLPLFAQLTNNASGVTFTVLPNTTGGLLPIGATTDLVLDDASRPVGVVAVFSSATLAGRGGVGVLPVAFLCAWLAARDLGGVHAAR